MTTWMLIGLLAFCAGDATRSVEEDEIKSVVQQYVQSRLGSSSQEVRVEFRSIPNRILNIPKDARLHVVTESVPDLQGNVILPVEVVHADRVVHTFLVSLRVRTFGQVLVAAETMGKHQQGSAIPVVIEQRETTTLPPDVLTSPEQLQGKRTRQFIRRGAVLRQSMFESQPLIRQGSVVTLVVKTGAVLVRTAAIVREDGLAGDRIRVQKLGSHEVFSARVVDAETVELTNEQ